MFLPNYKSLLLVARLQWPFDIRPTDTQICRHFKVHNLITYESKVQVVVSLGSYEVFFTLGCRVHRVSEFPLRDQNTVKVFVHACMEMLAMQARKNVASLLAYSNCFGVF